MANLATFYTFQTLLVLGHVEFNQALTNSIVPDYPLNRLTLQAKVFFYAIQTIETAL
jgi:hypothetical protein